MDNTGKITDNKLNYELYWEFIELMAKRMQLNKGKYAPYAWKSHMSIEDLKQALFRHTLEIMKDNTDDDGQKYGHLASVALNSMFLHFQFQKSEKEIKESCLEDLVKDISNDQLLGATVRQMIK